ncbi:SDR family NAD(P)-dependent oxidoreductase [Burkholderia gladioli]|uniref:SDR family NAD(P)-dependent oxidoreductase n=1 Tax=Burkholderia gladioli TaxID=28095 RepID=UPI00163ECEC0|nr:SDR family NAD(P)-dependent oxidoreductase [Burkholderia gladioli]
MTHRHAASYELDFEHDNLILRDHRVHGVSILPGVTLIDVVYRLGQHLLGHQRFELAQLLFRLPLATSGHLARRMTVRFAPGADRGCWTVSLSSVPLRSGVPGTGRDLHAECVLRELDAEDLRDPAEADFDVAGFIASAERSTRVDEVYRGVRELGVVHGPFMQTLGEIFHRGDEELMRLSLGPLAESLRERFHAHPALLDGATFAGSAFKLVGEVAADFRDDRPHIPFSVERVRLLRPFPARILVASRHGDKLGGAGAGAARREVTSSDLRILDEEGRVLALFERLSYKRVRQAADIVRLVDQAPGEAEGAVAGEAARSAGADVGVGAVPASTVAAGHDGARAAALAAGESTRASFDEALRRFVTDQLAAQGVALAGRLGDDTPFFDAGLDSTHLLALVRALETHCGRTFYPTLLFEHQTLRELAAHLHRETPAAFGQAVPVWSESVAASSQQPAAPSEPSVASSQPSAASPAAATSHAGAEDAAAPARREIAVIGLAGRYPGAATLEAFWEAVVAARPATGALPADQWSRHVGEDDAEATAAATLGHGGALADADAFDALFFGMTPADAAAVDPQARLLLETAWHACEDAACLPATLARGRTGVYIGVMNDDYTWVAAEHLARTGSYASAGSYAHELANRLSHQFDLRGPSMTVESACSSSLLALHLARTALLAGECDFALAGGVNLSLHRSKYLLLAGLGLMSADGRERTFDIGANGYVPGEGVGLALLKPMEAALADGDRIHGVIAGSATNHSGRAAGRYSPNLHALVEVIERGVASAGLAPEAIGHVETHGTGTQLGDPIEVQAIARALGAAGRGDKRCTLGSRANFGHLESASGIGALTKTLLGMRRGLIPPCANLETLNPALRLDETALTIPREAMRWTLPLESRVSGIHAFGIGGSNVFMVARGAARPARPAAPAARDELIVLSARDAAGLERVRAALAAHLRGPAPITDEEPATLGDLALTLQLGRTAFAHRLAFVVASREALLAALDAHAEQGGQGADFAHGVVRVDLGVGAAADRRDGPALSPELEARSRDGLRRLADAWVNGATIDWARLHAGRATRRVAAPLYPFARDRHRIDAALALRAGTASRADAVDAQAAARPAGGTAPVQVRYGVPAWREEAVPDTGVPSDEVVHLVTSGVSAEVLAGIAAETAPASAFALPVPGDDGARGAAAVYFAAFEALRRVSADGVREPRRLVVLVAGEADELLHAPLAGLLRTAAREYPRLRPVLVFAPGPLDIARGAAILRDEMRASSGDGQALVCRHLDGRRELRVHREAIPPAAGPLPVRQRGVYWITGGLGGLGRLFARYLAGFGEVDVILSGRAPASEQTRAACAALAAGGAPGARVHYLAVDVGRADEVERGVAQIVAQHGGLDGVLHCAGLTRDALIVRKTADQAGEVFAAKLAGTEAIDRATRALPLDFLVLCSSIAAVWGNPGQADYAAANAWLDAFAARRNACVARGMRQGRTVSINWPLWREGGMRVAAEAIEALRAQTGMAPLETADGLAALEHALAGDADQWIVCPSDGRLALFDNGAAPPPSPARDQAPAVQPQSQAPAAQPVGEAVLDYLRDKLARIFRLPAASLDPDAFLSSYGIDSANVLALTAELERDLGVLPKTLVYEHPTLAALAAYLGRTHHAALARRLPAADAAGGAGRETADAVAPALAPASAPSTAAPAAPAAAVAAAAGAPLDIAIVGMSGRFPQARDLDAFWRNLRDGRDCISEIPASRWDLAHYYDDGAAEPGRIHSKWGGFIDGVDEFDPLFFRISPLEAEMMDPQERLFLQAAWETIEDAGYTRAALADAGRAPHQRVGVYVGVMYSEYQLYGFQQQAERRIFGLPGNTAGVANRVSYFFDFHGPSMSLDTMCSSSLTAIHLACRGIAYGECGVALAGGVNLSIHPNKYAVLSQARIISTKGRCESFGKGGEGYIPGEGVGCVMLKPLARALADRDAIHGIVKGTALSHGGRANGYTVPNPGAQAATISMAIEQAGVAPRAISYIEAHGTGTSLGDPIEIAGLVHAFGELGASGQFCAIGSAKSNIGHGESAAGIAGVCKVLLQMRHRQLAPSLHSAELNPYIDFASSPFAVQRELGEWRAPLVDGVPMPRVAGVSSFGAGGSNAHVVIEEAPAVEAPAASAQAPGARLLVPISARTEERLRVRVADLIEALSRPDAPPLDDVAWTLRVGREPMEYRAAFVVSTLDGLLDALRGFLDGASSANGWHGRASAESRDVLGDEDVRRAVIQSWSAAGRIDKLAQFWTCGLELDWEAPALALPSARRTHLPPYPFERRACWVPVRPTPAASAARPGSLLSRMLPAASLTDRPRVAFETTLSPALPLVDEHRVRGQRVLPGVAYAELVLEAARHVYPERRASLTELVWMQPLVVGEESVAVVTQLERHDGVLRFEIASMADGARRVHAQGTAELDAPEAAAAGEAPAALRARLAPWWEGEAGREAFYEAHRGNGIEYGPGLRRVLGLWGGDQEALGLVDARPARGETGTDFLLPPPVADAALQCVAGIAGARGAAGELQLPYSIGRVAVLRPIEAASVHVHVRRTAPGHYDLAIVDEAGEPYAVLGDLVVRAAKPAIEPLCYAGRWQRAGAVAVAEAAPAAGTALIVSREAGVALGDALAAAHSRAVWVRLGGAAAAARAANAPAVDGGAAFAEALGSAGVVDTVYFLAAVVGQARYRLDARHVAEELEATTLAWFRCVKALVDAGFDQRALDVVVVTQDGETPPLQQEINIGGAALSGFTQALASEYPHWRVRGIDVGRAALADPARLAAAIAGEPHRAGAFPVALRDGLRYEHRIAPLELPPAGRAAFVEGGVYVIVGGAGGIGRILTAHLVRRYRATVIWLGRRALDAALREQLAAASTEQARVDYFQVDVSAREALERVRDAIRASHGRINGVLHSALVLRDASVRGMDETALREALAPKVAGSAVLGEVFMREDLDWLGFYSSMQSFRAGAGQANYAAGCTFQDSYARALGRACAFPVFTLNWGYWGSVGVVANERTRQRMAALGIGSIEPDDGMAVQEAALAHEIGQLLAIRLAPAARESLGFEAAGQRLLPARAPSRLAATVAALEARVPDAAAIRDIDAADIALNAFVVARLREAMQALGLARALPGAASADAARRALGVVERHAPLFEEILRILADDHAQPSRAAPGAAGLLADFPDLAAHVALAEACLDALPRVLRGELPATEVMFPGGSMALVEGIYKRNVFADYLNDLVADVVERRIADALADPERVAPVRILEVGAGTGGTSDGLFRRLGRFQDRIEYVYTDVSKHFLLHAREQYSGVAPYLTLQLFDAEQAPDAQGIDPGSVDIVVAANVLHATRDIAATLANVKRCLARHGLLVMNEIAGKRPFTTLSFGLLDGWWAAVDREVRLEGSPGLTAAQWTRVLAEVGFSRSALSAEVSSVIRQHVIVAESDGRIAQVAPRGAGQQAHGEAGAGVAAAAPAVPAAPARDAERAAAAAAPAPASATHPPRASGEAPSLPAQAAASAADPRARVDAALREAVAQALKLAPDELDPTLALSELGVDSIVAVDLVRRINDTLGLALKTTVIFDFPTLDRLAAHLCATCAAELSGGGGAIDELADALERGALSLEESLARLKS